MFRVTSLVINRSKILLWRTNPVELRIACLSRSPAVYKHIKQAGERERDPCPQPPPPPPRLRDDRRFWGAVLLILMTGGFAAYAKTNPELRDWLTIGANWFDDFVAVLHRENYGFIEEAIFFARSCKKFIEKQLEGPPDCTEGVPPPPPVNVAITSEEEEEEEDDDDDDDDDDNDDEDEDDEDDESPCVPLLPPVITKDICELEACLRDLGDTVIANLSTCKDACVVYNDVVKDAMLQFTYKKFRNLKPAKEERNYLVDKHLKKFENVMPSFSDMQRYIDCGCTAPPDRLAVTKQIWQDYNDLITRLKIEFDIELALADKMDSLAKSVEDKVETIAKQNMCVYPGLDYESNLVLNGDPDYLLIQTIKILAKLRDQVMSSLQGMTARVNGGVYTLPYKKEDLDKKIDAAHKKALGDLDKEFQQRITDLKKDYENEKKMRLSRQKQRHEEGLATKLAKQEKELETRMEEMIAERVEAEKKKMDIELREMAGELLVVETKLQDKLRAEEETKRAQKLYAAASSMLNATKRGEPYVKVNKELAILEKESGFETGDKLVMTVLNAIPYEVKQKGIVPTSVIREKFTSMEDVALKVSMVQNEGGPLIIYMFSWLQSLFLFMKLRTIPQHEIDYPLEEPFEGLDTFDLLQRARYFMEQGQLANALRYVNALEGASRGAAEAWYNIANNHLQTKQAAEAIIAHAAAISLQYI